jgi:hypothetical protein
MANKFYGAISHIGGADGDLDSISTSVLSDGDGAMVIDAILNEVYFYTLDSSSSEVEDTTNFTVIKPDDEGSTPGKRWLLVSSASVGGTFTSTVTLEDTANGQILMNPSNGALEITRVGGSPFIDLKNQIADDFDVRMVLSGGNLLFQGKDGAATETMAEFKPGLGCNLYYDNAAALKTAANGINVLAAGANTAEIVYTGDTLLLKSFVHGGELELRGEDAGGSTVKYLQGNPDGATSLYYTDKKTMDTFVNGGEYGIRLYASDSNSVKLIKRDPGGLQIQHQRDEDTFSTGLDVIETDGAQGEGWTGAVHGISVSTIMNQNYVADEEGGGIFNNLQGTGTATLWGQDNLTFGPTAVQATKIVGLSQFVANRNAAQVNSVGLSVVTDRQGGGPTEIASTQTYTMQAGIVVTGVAGNASGTDAGFKYGMMIGNFSFGGWFPATQSRFTYGMIIDSYSSGGIHIGQPYSGTAPYLTFGGGSPGDDPNDSNDYLKIIEEGGAIVWRDPRQTDSWTISQNADNIAFIGGADNTGHVTIGSEITLTAKATGSVAINSLFHNSADGKLYWKDAAGTDHALY